MARKARYPKSYIEAAGMLHDRRVQTLAIHDELTLTFMYEAVAVLHNDEMLVQWSTDKGSIALIASKLERGATERVVEFIKWFLPWGYSVKANSAGRMLLHHPDGSTTIGNRQRIDLTDRVFDLDEF